MFLLQAVKIHCKLCPKKFEVVDIGLAQHTKNAREMMVVIIVKYLRSVAFVVTIYLVALSLSHVSLGEKTKKLVFGGGMIYTGNQKIDSYEFLVTLLKLCPQGQFRSCPAFMFAN